jgi:hypothetical protein
VKKHIAALALSTMILSGIPAMAAERTENGPVTVAKTDDAVPVVPAAAAPPLTVKPATSPAEWLASHRRPRVLPALYASFAALQIVDVYSTRSAISAGAQEANPLMKNVVGNSAMFWTVKAAATVGPMLAAERLWKKNKVAAIAVMAVSNGFMAAVAAHNTNVRNSQR